MYISFYEFLNEGRKSLLSDDERVERDTLFKLGKKKRSQEQEKRYNELVLKAAGIENGNLLNTDLSLDDFVDFNKIDLYSEYEKMSNLLYDKGIFEGLLPNIPIKKMKYKAAMAHVKLLNKQIQYLIFNTTYKVTYGEFLGILAHECIHVLMAHNKEIKTKYDYHGRKFENYMNKINKANLGFIVNIRHTDEVLFNEDEVLEHFIIIVNSKIYSGVCFLVTKNQKIIDDFKQDVKKNLREFRANSITVYKTQNPYFTKFPTARVLRAYHNISDEKTTLAFNNNLTVQTELVETITL